MKTLNRLIIILSFSEVINFILLKKNISGNDLIFGSNFELFVDRSALIFSESIGLFFLLIMLFSVAKLKRQKGYVLYFIFLGFLCSLVYLFSFSGSLFHNLYDPLISYLDKTGISF